MSLEDDPLYGEFLARCYVPDLVSVMEPGQIRVYQVSTCCGVTRVDPTWGMGGYELGLQYQGPGEEVKHPPGKELIHLKNDEGKSDLFLYWTPK